jgi:predicted enzyme related to lactoylglutathione lyase
MSSPFVYLQLQTSDPEEAAEFYRGLFGWIIADGPDYREIDVGEGTAGGIMRSPAPGAPSAWLPYVAVADVDASTRRAEELGATVVAPPSDAPGKGRFSVLRDPAGAAFALWTALS